MAQSASISALQKQLWRKELFTDVRDLLYIDRFIGTSEQSMIQEFTDLRKEKGSRINFGLAMKLSGNGITGDNTLEGNEEAMQDYATYVTIDQIRHAVLLTGKMDEKKNAYDMRVSAKNRLASWIAEYVERDMFFKLCGDITTTRHDFANDTSAAAATRSVFAGGQSAVANITTAMKFDTKCIDAAKQKAEVASPKIRPIKVNGKSMFVMFIHPYDATNLRQDPVWNQAQRDANVRGEENPIFSGAMGVYNNVVIHVHDYVYRYNDGSGSAYVSRNILCGQQAGVIAWGMNVDWVEKSFDYENQQGFACGAIFGTSKPIFNSLDYGVITVFAASAVASTA